ncbi:hypothetical protein OAV76_03440 [Schleiferiaceae bacterium]|nr:hypothetical protein [Schleiferiaceae bacterium]
MRKTKKENILGAFVILLLMSFFTGNAQVGIGTSSPNPAAALEITSTSQGLLPPRMRASERNAIINPPAGLVIWCSDCGDNGELQVFNGLTFTNIVGDESSVTPRTQLGSILGGNNDCFSSAVGLSSDGSILAAGAPRNDGNGWDAGHVRVYEYSFGTWTQLGNDIDGEAAYDYSGISLSLSSDGTTVAVGAPRNDGNGLSSGQLRVYRYNSGFWVQLGGDIDGDAADDYLGGGEETGGFPEPASSISLSSDGSIVAVGAPRNDGNGSDAGHVRVYEFNSGSWIQLGSDIEGEATYDEFGKAVSLSANGSILAEGAPRNDGNGSDAGHVRVYEFNSGSWTQLGNDIDGEATNDWFGKAVSLSANGSILAAGAPGNDGNGTEAGHVRVYEYNSGSWTQLGRDDNGVDQYNRYGISLNISSDGTKLVIGAVGYNGIGSARVITDLKTTGL